MQMNIEANKGRAISTAPVINLELLALDLSRCTRCVGTADHIEAAIDIIRPALEVMDVHVNVRKTVIQSAEQALDYEFGASPTVRINGRDIAIETLENKCESCTELSGCEDETSCRVWRYHGAEYTEVPVGLVVEAILREIFDSGRASVSEPGVYSGVPENLQRFFKSKSVAQPAAHACCPPTEQETCCDSDRKEACCDDAKPQACGCHRTDVGASR